MVGYGAIAGGGGSRGGNATALQGEPIDATAPTTGQLLGYDGAQWTPTSLAEQAALVSLPYVDGAPAAGSGTAGAYGTVKSYTVPANYWSQVGDVVRLTIIGAMLSGTGGQLRLQVAGNNLTAVEFSAPTMAVVFMVRTGADELTVCTAPIANAGGGAIPARDVVSGLTFSSTIAINVQTLNATDSAGQQIDCLAVEKLTKG